MNDRLLIVGGDGLLGGALKEHWSRESHDVIATSRRDSAPKGVLRLDLSQEPRSWPELPECGAAVICAALTNLEQCRRDPAGTSRVNVTHTLELAKRLTARGCFVVFISTNLVFDGRKPFCAPDEPTRPALEYGRQKAAAEAGLKSVGDRAAIVRLTKVIHPALPLLRGWIQSLTEGKPVSAFSDFVCAPIPLAATVRAIARVAGKRSGGVWHLSASADVSYADIARQFARRIGRNESLVQAGPARDTANLEHLPEHTTLDARRAQAELGFEIPSPADSIDRTFFP